MVGQIHALANLPLGKEPRYPLERRLGPGSNYSNIGPTAMTDIKQNLYAPSHVVTFVGKTSRQARSAS
jgi:hypothetical protein